MILAEREYTENIFKANGLMSFKSLFLLFIRWCPIFNNKYYFAKLRCFGNAVYFSAMTIFLNRVLLFIRGFKKSVSVVNERGDSLKRVFECRCFCSWMEVARKYRCLNTMCTCTPNLRCYPSVFDPPRNFIPSQIYRQSFQLNTYSRLCRSELFKWKTPLILL